MSKGGVPFKEKYLYTYQTMPFTKCVSSYRFSWSNIRRVFPSLILSMWRRYKMFFVSKILITVRTVMGFFPECFLDKFPWKMLKSYDFSYLCLLLHKSGYMKTLSKVQLIILGHSQKFTDTIWILFGYLEIEKWTMDSWTTWTGYHSWCFEWNVIGHTL